MGNEPLFEVAAELIAQADSLIVSAGAGIGVDSGLPDFRGTTGFWSAYPSLAQDKVDFFRIACPDAFRSQPLRAWGFYGHRLNLYRTTTPHEGFQILKRWGESMPRGYAVFTSNVDGQFQKAGFDPATVHECHGSIHHLQCLEPCCSDIWSADGFNPEVDWENCRLLNVPPKCPRCKGLARPNILMFSDGEWLTQRQDDQAGRFAAWLSRVERPVVVEVGAGTSIPSVRRLSHQILQGFNGRLVRINPREFAVPTSMDVGLACDAGYALAAIDKLVSKG